MSYQFIPYTVLLIASAMVTMGLGIYGLRHKSGQSTKVFGVCMAIGTLWSSANALEISALTLQHKLIWANVQYIAYALGPVAWLFTVLHFTGNLQWANRRNLLVVLVVPIVTIILVWADVSLGLVRHSLRLDWSGPFPVIAKEYGPWFWVHFTHSYLLNFLSVFLVVRTLTDKNAVYRGQALFVFGGIGLVILSNLLYTTGLSPVKHFDLTPIVFSLSGALIVWGISRFHLLGLVPIARDKVLEAMESAVIVVDDLARIVDVNPAFHHIFPQNTVPSVLGVPLSVISPKLADLISHHPLESSHVIELRVGGQERYYETSVSVIPAGQSIMRGWVLVLHDITELKHAQEQLHLEQQESAVSAERDRFTQDLHDNLGQILGFCGMQIKAIERERQKRNDETVDRHLRRLGEIVAEAQLEMGRYVHDLRYREYLNSSFGMLVEKQVRRLVESTVFSRDSVILNIAEHEFSVEVKIQLVNIVKEAINNVLKHSKATKLQIKLASLGDQWELVVTDNGVGFEPRIAVNDQQRGSGLSIMEERARLLGGNLSVHSTPGKTEVRVEFPKGKGEV